MKAFLFLCSLVLLGLTKSNAAPNTYIVGGWDAEVNQFPHQIALYKNSRFICGGSIIHEKYVVTAAHCVGRHQPAYSFQVKAGTNDIRNEGVLRDVVKVFVHEDYENLMNDIAVIKLSRPLEWNESIQPIDLYDNEVSPNSDITISGWGKVYQGGPISNKLKYNILKSVENEICKRLTFTDFDGVLCLTHPRNNGVCDGDAGIPAVYQGRLVGIGSFRIGGCGTVNPDGFVKVSYYVKWIKSILRNN